MSLVWDLGLVGYSNAYDVQRRLHRQRLMDEIPDVLLLLEHPPTMTIGKSGSIENVLASRGRLSKEGISLFFTERGGDVTYHGPGQIVGYPIIDLKQRRKDIRGFVYDIEEVIIRVMKDFSIDAGRDESHPGVWVERKEVAAIGLSVRRWVSMHGFAVNVNPNMEHFSLINPCGFNDREAVSMAQLLGEKLMTDAVKERLISHFSEIFDAPVAFEKVMDT